MDETKEYLGDSVYVVVEDGMIKLTTENGYKVSNTIFIEPQVMEAFIKWYKRLNEVSEL